MNKKYIKISFIIFFVLFLAFVITRKIMIDKENIEKSQVAQSSKSKIIQEKKDIDPRTKINLQDKTSKTNNKIKEEKIASATIEQKSTAESKDAITEDVSKMTMINLPKKEEKIEEKIASATMEQKPTLETKKEISKEQITETIPLPVIKEVKVEEIKETKEVKEDIKQIEVYSIKDLKLIKEKINISTNDNSFIYENRSFREGDSFGIFTITEIKPKKIRFKKNEYFFYSLRFFI